MHTIDSMLRAVSRGGKKFGALCFYMENWHLDFPEFLDLRQNSGDPYRRTRTANTAVWISDEFMKRVQNDDDWYLFDPLEVSELNELYGKAFSERYAHYVAEAEAGNLRMFKKMKAREQFKAILISLQTSSHPWLTWKDTINNRALNNNTGTIHLSNLCTEITLPQDVDNVAVCNLASINLSRHLVRHRRGAADASTTRRSRRARASRCASSTTSSTSPAPRCPRPTSPTTRTARSASASWASRMSSRSSASATRARSRTTWSTRSWSTSPTRPSTSRPNLAAERGAYANFEGSRWSQGLVPIDSIALTEEDRGVPIKVNRTTRLDWDALRAKVKGGMRNATLMAIAPTASIGLVAGTTPGFDPQFTQIFSRSTSSGKFLEVNRNLVRDLRALGLWDHGARVDPAQPGRHPDRSRRSRTTSRPTYKTSFQLSPYAFLEIAARAQKWIDQAISRNMYLETRDLGEMMDIYYAAWERGVKTTYYLHSKPRHQAEQTTVRVNKSEDRDARKVSGSPPRPTQPAPAPAAAPARRGFGFSRPHRRRRDE